MNGLNKARAAVPLGLGGSPVGGLLGDSVSLTWSLEVLSTSALLLRRLALVLAEVALARSRALSLPIRIIG